jgi:hypothetical protein
MIKFFSKPKQTYVHEVGVCCIVKDEDRYLEEWINYHKQIGITYFYFYDNGSTIPVEDTVRAHVASGLVQVINYPGKGVQLQAYQHCLDNYRHNCKWIAFIDMDEFIVPKSTNGDLPLFLNNFSEYAGVGINWLVFGSNGHVSRPEGLQTENFTKRSLKNNPINKHIKSIVQTAYVISAGDNPHEFNYQKKMFCMNENKVPVNGPFSDNSTNLIQLNHYMNRSREEQQEKVLRGMADMNPNVRNMDLFYEVEGFANVITDESIKEIRLLKREAGK